MDRLKAVGLKFLQTKRQECTNRNAARTSGYTCHIHNSCHGNNVCIHEYKNVYTCKNSVNIREQYMSHA